MQRGYFKSEVIRMARKLRSEGTSWNDVHEVARGMGYNGKKNALCMLVARDATRASTASTTDFESQIEALIAREAANKVREILAEVCNKISNSKC